jgi:thiol-disulfide isomerase/thioredoxin
MSEGLGRLFGGVKAPLTLAVHMPGFEGASGWVNSQPLTVEDLRGRVVLVDFWTYTCINWLRTLGYVRAWAEKYRHHGLVVVGVHTPEFPFEGDVENVQRAVRELGVDYPVAIDSDYAIWNAFANRYWPAVYVADAQGRIRHHHFGEGGYEECERVVQGLLRDSGRAGVPDDLVSVADEGLEAQADWETLRSPETYLNELPRDRAPSDLGLNEWTLVGDWRVEARASALDRAGGAIAFRFHARDVNLVLGPPQRDGTPIPFRVTLDGEPPGADHGLDVDEQGNGEVAEQRLYQLVRQQGEIADRTFEIAFTAAGVEAYVFTFG